MVSVYQSGRRAPFRKAVAAMTWSIGTQTQENAYTDGSVKVVGACTCVYIHGETVKGCVVVCNYKNFTKDQSRTMRFSKRMQYCSRGTRGKVSAYETQHILYY